MKTVDEYKKKGDLRQGTPNKARARSLQEQAKARIKDVEQLPLTEESAPFRFEDAYEALREMIQSFMEIEGLKPYSHEATIAYAKEKHLMQEMEVRKADNYRKIRNDISYRAEKVSVERTKRLIEFARKIINQLDEK